MSLMKRLTKDLHPIPLLHAFKGGPNVSIPTFITLRNCDMIVRYDSFTTIGVAVVLAFVADLFLQVRREKSKDHLS